MLLLFKPALYIDTVSPEPRHSCTFDVLRIVMHSRQVLLLQGTQNKNPRVTATLDGVYIRSPLYMRFR
jgi:uncharacterized protein YhhL (DUF1145 family)